MTTHTTTQISPDTYHLQWVCSCGWAGMERPVALAGSAGAEMLRHRMQTTEGEADR